LEKLPGPTPLLDDRAPGSHVPSDAPRAEAEYVLAEQELAALRAAAASASVSFETLLEGGWALVQCRHARESYVVFGEEWSEERILPAPIAVDPNQRGREWLATLEASRAARLSHAGALPRDLGASQRSLFDSALVLDERCFESPSAAARRSALRVGFEAASRRLRASYAKTRLDAVSVERALRHWFTALTELAARPDAAIGELSLLSDYDRVALSRFNSARSHYEKDSTLARLVEATVARKPDAVALITESGSLTYRDLNRRANRLAHRLQSLGVGPDSLVGLCLERTADLVVGALAILKAGGAYVPLDPSYPPERLGFMVEDAAMRVILLQKSTEALVPSGGAQRLFLDDAATFANFSEENPANAATPEHLAYVIFTSGSTGRPKGVLVPNRTVSNLLASVANEPGLPESGVMLALTTLSFDISVAEIWLPLVVGAKILLVTRETASDGARLRDVIEREGATFLDATPVTYRLLLAAGWKGNPELTVVCTGEAMPKDLAIELVPRAGSVWNGYGPTETTVWATFWRVPSQVDRILIGHAVANTRLYVLDEGQREVPIGVVGELYIGGDCVTRGYLARPELTQERFLPDPFGAPGERMYRTGDLARYQPDGELECLGRVDFQVKLRGYRIELGEIEFALQGHAAVREAAVALREDRAGEPRLVAYLVAEVSAARPSTAELREALTRNLPEFMVPATYVWVESLPTSPSGKLDRKRLPPPARDRPDTGKPFVAPRSDRERLISQVFGQVLDLDQVGAEDSFFDLGGNSLLSMKVVAILRDQHHLDLPVARFFQYPTPRELAKYLARDAKAANNERLASRLAGKSSADSIAIVGMAGRFPGARDVATLWQNVCAGLDSISHFSAEELDPSLPKELAADSMYVRARGIIEDYDKFDAAFFGIGPKDAELMDPQQRLFLEACWEALEFAGYVPETIRGLVGVFGGVYGNSYLTNNVLTHPEYEERLGSLGVLVHNDKDYVATRVAHKLDLTGPAVSIHTACSTSLVAVVEAFHSLRTGQCDLALAGAASITCPPKAGYWYIEGGMLSPDGHTRSFDAGANGTTFNDGLAVVVLKRLADAVEDGDTIYGVIRGAAINNDGGRKASFTAPSVEGQAAVIRMAQAVAGVDARSISYVEAHGTATPLGDPIEVEALTEAFRASTDDKQFCAISSIKSNIGHLVSAAGTAGLIKTAFSLMHKVIPPTAHFRKSNPSIDFANSPFFVADRLMPWPEGPTPRRAGVSSFGVGGTNAHVVVEEPPVTETTASPRPRQLLMLSARTKTALEQAALRLSRHLEAHPELDLADVASTLARGRRAFSERAFVVASSTRDAAANLAKAARLPARRADGNEPSVAFLFPGQGAQYANMGRALYRDDPVFRTVVDECATRLLPLIGRDLRELLYPALADQDEAAETLRNTAYTQPALFTIEYATAQVLLGLGIRPEAMIGHSIGEFVAAVLAGVMSLEDALGIVAARGRMMQNLPKGSMLSVRLPAEVVAPRLSPSLALASDNGPTLCVVAGPTPEVEQLKATLEAEGVACRHLLTSHAFHSPMMDAIVEPFAELVSKIQLHPPRIPFVSTLTGTWIKDEEAQSPQYWARHLRQTVRFAPAVRTLLEQPGRVLVEVGPRATLSTLARQQTTETTRLVAVPTLGDSAEEDAEWSSFLSALGQLWLSGAKPDWQSFFIEERRRRVALPTYPFEPKRYWIEPAWAPPAHRPSGYTAPQPLGFAKVSPAVAAPLPAPEPLLAPELAPRPAPPSPVPPTPAPPSEFQMTTATAPAQPRLPRLISKLREVFESVSGFDMDSAEETASFLELGFDSLALTQVALQLHKEFGVKVTFRELMDAYSSLDSLGTHLDAALPAERFAAPAAAPPLADAPPAAAPSAAATPAYAAPGYAPPTASAFQVPRFAAGPADGSIRQVIDQQLLIMQQQLALLGGMQSAAFVAPTLNAPAAVSAPAPAPVAPAPVAASPAASAPAPTNGATATGAPPVASKTAGGDGEEAHLKYDVKKAFGAIARIHTSRTDELTPQQRTRLDAFIRRYNSRTRRSKEFTQEHRIPLADPRAVTGFRPILKEIVYQIVIDRSHGPRVWDIDGNEYVDALNGFGSSLFGWQPDFVTKAAIHQLERGHEIGPMPTLAGDVAKLICEFTGFDRAGFCNTGSEAVMGCMRIARTITGRTTIASFNNSYHGIFDEVLVRGTKKLRAVSAAPGVMPSSSQNMLVLDYGTPESLEILKQRGEELAAILVEPVQSRRPDFQPREFLHELRKVADACGAVLIFDEVITGFRSHPGGAQAYFGVRADLGSYGKVIGGGFPFGVIAGKQQYMDALDGGYWQFGDDSLPTVGVTYFAGTFCRHPLALAAAKASLLHLKERGPALQLELNAKTEAMAKQLNTYFESVGAPVKIKHFSSLWKAFFTEDLPFSDLLFYYLRDRGLHILDGFPCFLTTAHTDADIAFIVRAFQESISEMQAAGFLPGRPVQENVPLDPATPPVPGARLGRDPSGTPAWFVPHPENPQKYVKYGTV
jgi:amino acid adenylation domain-containing protein